MASQSSKGGVQITPPEWMQTTSGRSLVIALLLLVLLPLAILADIDARGIDGALFFVWVSCTLLYVSATSLNRLKNNSILLGYQPLATGLALFLLGPGWALLSSLVGTLLHMMMHRLQTPATEFHRVTTHAQIPIFAINGLGVVMMTGLFSIAGGTIPLTNALDQVVGAVFAIAACVISTPFITRWLVDPAYRPFWHRGEHYRAIPELIPVALIVPLAFVYRDAGLWTFAVLMLLVTVQPVLQRQSGENRFTLMQRVRELSLINEVGRQISANLVLDDVLQSIQQWITEFADVRIFYISLHDDERDWLRYLLVTVRGQSVTWADRPLDRDALSAQVITSQDVVDTTVNTLPVTGKAFQGHYLGFPLFAGDKLLGVLGFFGDAQARINQQFDQQTLQTLANQTALAIRNAMLYDHSTVVADNLNRMNASINAISSTLEIDEILAATRDTARDITQADRVAILLTADATSKSNRIIESLNLTEAHHQYYETIDAVPKETVITANALQSAYGVLAEMGQFRAMVHLPLRSGTSVIGLLAVFHNQRHQYLKIEQEMLETLAHQMVIALDNAELLNALEIYAAEQAQLVHLSRISSASLELPEVVAGISQILQQMLDVHFINVGLQPEGTNYVQLFDADGSSKAAMVLDEITEVAAVLHSNQPAIVRYRVNDATISDGLQSWMQHEGLQTLLVTPLLSDEKTQGILLIGTDQMRDLITRDIRVIEMASGQIATQFQNVQRFEKTRSALDRRLQELAFIEEIAQQITRSLDLDTLIRNVLETAIRATGADYASIGIRTDRGELRIIGLESTSSPDLRVHTATWSSARGIMKQVMTSGKLTVIPDTHDNQDYYAYPEDSAFLSCVVVPLKYGTTMTGVLNVESNRLDFFQDEQIDFAINLAGHATISIQNARLLEARQSQIETLTQLRELSLQLSSDKHRDEVIRTILCTSLDMLHGETAALYDYDLTTQQINHTMAIQWVNQSFETAQAVVPESLIARAIETGDIQVVDDVRTSDDFLSFVDSRGYAYTAILVAPLQYTSTVNAVLCVTLPAHRPYQDSDRNTIQLLAIQASGHLKNTLLYQQIRTQNDRMHAILDSTRDGILLLDRDGNLIEANNSAESLLNVNLQPHIGRHFVDSMMQDLRQLEKNNSNLHNALTDMLRVLRLQPKTITTRSFEIRHGDQIQYMQEVGSPVQDQDQGVVGRLITLRDVTEERMLAAYRDEISSMVVHDLRGPLGSMISSLSLALETAQQFDDDENTIAEMITVSIESAQNLMGLVDSLLEIAQMETRRMPLRRTANHLQPIVDEAYRALMTAVKKAGIIVEIELADDLPMIEIDNDKVRRVVINLLDNAIRFTPTGERVRISGTLRGDKVYVTVADSGPGIPQQEAQRIFEKFQQSTESKPKRGSKGSGLGLTFCKLAIEAHDEHIWVEAPHNCDMPGACFTFTLPVVAARPMLETVDSAPESRNS